MQSNDKSKPFDSQEVDTSWIPDGYQLIIGPDGKEYIMPDFAIPALDDQVRADRIKKKLKVSNAAGTVRNRGFCHELS